MRKTATPVFTLLLFAGLARAQVPAGNAFLGYSYYSADLTPYNNANNSTRNNTNGFEASLEGRIIPFLGFVADFDGHYGSQNILPPLCPVAGPPCTFKFNTNFSENNYLFGPRVSLPMGRIRPFAEALFGVARVHGGEINPDTSFATAIGGGLDYKIIKPIAWRFQGDYVRTSLFSATQNNVRISTGIVLRF
ncbi:MAG: hypothetical protein WBC78_03240 [Candidatus Sulfotelmatobacter sp.]